MWVKHQCMDAQFAGALGPTCRFDPAFWVTNTSRALLSISFKPGRYLVSKEDCNGGFLTPSMCLLSLGLSSAAGIPRLPSTGLTSHQVTQLLRNIFFIFHLISCDTELYPIVGSLHSHFSRFSLLAGALMWLEQLFRNLEHEMAWDALPPDSCLFHSKIVLYALDDLFALWDRWGANTTARELRYPLASCKANSTLCLMLETFPHDAKTLHDHLADWRTLTGSHLDRGSLSSTLSAQQHYATYSTPLWLLESINPAPVPSRANCTPRERDLQWPAPALAPAPAPSPRPSCPNSCNAPAGAARPASHCGPSKPENSPPGARRTPRSAPVPGESIARRCLFRLVEGARFHSINKIIMLARRNNVHIRCPRVNDPTSTLANNQSPPCFLHIIEGSHGCPNPQGCDFCHLDLQCDKTVNLRPEFFRKLLQLLDQPAVRQHFAPTQAFTDFCRSNHIQL